MRPNKEDKNKYVGVEVECYGPLDRNTLRERLSREELLQGKFQVGTDTSIEPDEQETEYMEEHPHEGALDIRPSDHPTRQLDLAEMIFRDGAWVVNRIITHRSRSRRRERLEDEMYWSNQDHEIENEPDPLHTYEVRLLAKQSEIRSVVKKLYKVLNEAECQVNESCGLHIHLDMRQRNPMVAYNNLFKCQDMLFNLHSEERAETGYTNRNRHQTLMGHVMERDVDKYFAINPLCYTRLRTLEVRIADGTMDIDRVLAWCDLLCTIVDEKEEIETRYNNIESFIDDYELIHDNSYETLEAMEAAA